LKSLNNSRDTASLGIVQQLHDVGHIISAHKNTGCALIQISINTQLAHPVRNVRDAILPSKTTDYRAK